LATGVTMSPLASFSALRVEICIAQQSDRFSISKLS
jgi:hypothetical protein